MWMNYFYLYVDSKVYTIRKKNEFRQLISRIQFFAFILWCVFSVQEKISYLASNFKMAPTFPKMSAQSIQGILPKN